MVAIHISHLQTILEHVMKSHVQILFGHLCWVGDLVFFPHKMVLIFSVSTAAQVTPCRKDGGTFSLSGCEPDACRSFPVDDFKSGYVVCRGGWEGMGVIFWVKIRLNQVK